MKNNLFPKLIRDVSHCRACTHVLPHDPRPIIQVNKQAKLLIIGQAPSLRVHQTGILWNDASGKRLREWIGLSNQIFYDETRVAILPMGFCYPGKGKHGDLPPQKACFPLWHRKLTIGMPNIQLTLLLGHYAHQAYLKKTRKKSLTATVQAWEEYLPHYLPFPHPSPRNNIWLRKNNWFEKDVIPATKQIINSILN
jgi:uracil-DNA glycosylase